MCFKRHVLKFALICYLPSKNERMMKNSSSQKSRHAFVSIPTHKPHSLNHDLFSLGEHIVMGECYIRIKKEKRKKEQENG